jgi:hypothetical protein
MLAAIPLVMAIQEPRDVLKRQQAMIDYVHQEYPAKTGYLDYSGMIADYPRVLKHLTSGNGIGGYHERGDPIIAREIDSGRLPFIIANHPVISEALEGRPASYAFLPEDEAAMIGNFVHQWGGLWREGKLIPAGAKDFEFELRRAGTFVLAGDAIHIDGKALTAGATIVLGRGKHLVTGTRASSSILWRGTHLPSPPPAIAPGDLFTQY